MLLQRAESKHSECLAKSSRLRASTRPLNIILTAAAACAGTMALQRQRTMWAQGDSSEPPAQQQLGACCPLSASLRPQYDAVMNILLLMWGGSALPGGASDATTDC